jgi:hypothetical protein
MKTLALRNSVPPVPFMNKTLLFCSLISISLSPAEVAAGADDILKTGRFVKHVEANKEQAPRLNVWVDSLRAVISDYQWEYGRRTNEGRLWQGFFPQVKDLHALAESTRGKTDTFLDSIRIVLDKKQNARLARILKKNDLLTYPIAEVPFHHINNTPLSPRFDDKASAYRVEIPGEITLASEWSYRDLLNTWTVNKYIRMADAMVNQTMFASPDVQVAANSPTLKSLIVKSPLILSASLMVPDLALSEFDVLFDNYRHTFASRESAWASFVAGNGLNDHVVVRLKMSTPYNEYYLSPERYIIFLEDSEGTGFEPIKIDKGPVRKLESLEIRIPGQTVTYTDVFGRYTGVPGYRETQTLSSPAKIRYTGQERLLTLHFPARNFAGEPIVTPNTRKLKLVIQPELENLPRMEMMWEMKKKPKARK